MKHDARSDAKHQLRIQDPSGGHRILPLLPMEKLTLGRDRGAGLTLKDPSMPKDAAVIWDNGGEYWVRIAGDLPCARLGDISIREAHLPSGLPLRLGDTRITLEPVEPEAPLPRAPSGCRPWLTASNEGAELLWTVRKTAETPLSIYLAGETGTGKEVLAHLIHAWSPRARGAFVPLHCGALPLSLVESELFGHVKGAFTGAIHQRPGALMQAHGGTLFLDEIGDLPLDIQVKLLRFLENGEIRPVGSDRTTRADVRLVCATHHPLSRLVEEGRFRRDLYYRLASVTIEIPALRLRPRDVEALARSFAAELARTLTEKAVHRLKAHGWPGNVRELRHAIERACGLSGPFRSVLDEDAFAFLLTATHISARPELELGVPILTLGEMERILLIKALHMAEGNRAEAARVLGVARSTLFEMLKRHGVRDPYSRRLVPADSAHQELGEKDVLNLRMR
jgi:DNA-binding NtrC family response regulator